VSYYGIGRYVIFPSVKAQRRLARLGGVVGVMRRKRALLTQQTEGGFPELKVLKQRLRNYIQPEMSLGHSDKPGTKVIQQ
jgi:predicted Rdx family selenoprotein